MRKLFLFLPVLLWSCGNQNSSNQNATSDTTSTIRTEPDITMSASALTVNTSKDENYGTPRVGKRIQLNNVYLGGTDKLSNTEVHVWGNDGNIPSWNGTYLCCRYIFKLSNPEDAKNAIQGKLATVTGTLLEYRDNNFTPPNANEQVILKEYVFENVTFTVNPETPKAEVKQEPASEPVQTTRLTAETQTPDATSANTTTTQTDADGRVTGTIVSDKAYFYSEMDRSTQKKAYLVKGDKIKYFDAKEGDFNMVFYKNSQGKTTSGWMLKTDIK